MVSQVMFVCATYLFLALLVPFVQLVVPWCFDRVSRIKSMAEQREDQRRCSWDCVSEEKGCADGVRSARNVLLRQVDLQQDD